MFLGLSYFCSGGGAKASAKSAFLVYSRKEAAGDPKPGELTMSRVNPVERRGEARTSICCKRFGRLVVRGNMPIELGDSWFSPKYVEA